MEKVINSTEKQIMLDGLMTYGMCENGLRMLDFACCEDAKTEPFTGSCKVQMMRDGNVYITELPKRVRNKALFRDDNCSLSKGRDGRWYFCFSLDEDELKLLPQKLVGQASAIAQKVLRELMVGENNL